MSTRKNINYTPEDFYKFGKEKMSKPENANYYGVAVGGIYNQMKIKPHLTEAYEAGKSNKAMPGSNMEAIEDTPIVETQIPAAELSYAEIEKLILNAIDAHCCTIGQIKKHAGLEALPGLYPIIDGMIADGKIVESEGGTITAYFRPEWKVQRFWMGGEHRLNIEFAAVGNEAPRPSNSKMVEVVEVDERFKETLESISQKHSGASIEKVKAELANEVKAVETPTTSLQEITTPKESFAARPQRHNFEITDLPTYVLSDRKSGIHSKTVAVETGKLSVEFDGNIFDLSREKRHKLNELIDLVQEF